MAREGWALASLFGVLILAITGFVPPPSSDNLIIFQPFFLPLSFLVVGRGGATYIGAASGGTGGAVAARLWNSNLMARLQANQ